MDVCENQSVSTTAIGDKRQTTLPADVCQAAGLQTNDQIEWRFEQGEIRGRKLDLPVSKEIGLEDVSDDGILPKGWKPDAESIAAAIREERDGQ
jgi:bifunctional DNA-binding transcriptional regulator/antitoxin component of YhaV-PrlF toxin-antitoxin module